MTYDSFDRVIESLTTEGIRSRFTYDINNNKLSEERILNDINSVKTNYEYNLLDKPIKTTLDISESLSGTTEAKYDGNENIIETILPNGIKKQYAYDSNDRLVQETTIPTDGQSNIILSSEYDRNGNKTASIDAKGNTSSIVYDGFDRPIRTVDSQNTVTEYVYDKL